MSEFVKGILTALIPALVVTVVTAWITVRLSLRRFRSEKWWEKKAETYSQLLEQLSYLQYYYEEWMNEDLGTKTLTAEKKKDLSDRQTKARESIIRVAAIGSYILSDNTATAVTNLRNGFYETDGATNDFGGFLNERHELVHECIEVIRKEAKNDLARD